MPMTVQFVCKYCKDKDGNAPIQDHTLQDKDQNRDRTGCFTTKCKDCHKLLAVQWEIQIFSRVQEIKFADDPSRQWSPPKV